VGEGYLIFFYFISFSFADEVLMIWLKKWQTDE